jgi:hypothetical protein
VVSVAVVIICLTKNFAGSPPETPPPCPLGQYFADNPDVKRIDTGFDVNKDMVGFFNFKMSGPYGGTKIDDEDTQPGMCVGISDFVRKIYDDDDWEDFKERNREKYADYADGWKEIDEWKANGLSLNTRFIGLGLGGSSSYVFKLDEEGLSSGERLLRRIIWDLQTANGHVWNNSKHPIELRSLLLENLIAGRPVTVAYGTHAVLAYELRETGDNEYLLIAVDNNSLDNVYFFLKVTESGMEVEHSRSIMGNKTVDVTDTFMVLVDIDSYEDMSSVLGNVA